MNSNTPIIDEIERQAGVGGWSASYARAMDALKKQERENARLWEVGQRLRDKLAFELECIGDSGDRDITEWDSLLPNVAISQPEDKPTNT